VSEENVNVVRRGFDSYMRGDLETAARLIDPQVEFRGTVGGIEEGRVTHGMQEFIERFEVEDLEAWDERRLEAEEFIDAGDQVVVMLHEFRRGKGSGVELESSTALICDVQEGRLVRIQGYMDRDAALEAVGLPKY
jgi:ketosteroid isomerase-like protein